MSMNPKQASELARTVVELAGNVGADSAEAVITAEDTALTRFANNRIHQNVADTGVDVNIRAVVGRRQGVASTNRLDDESLRATAQAAIRAAEASPEDPDFIGLPVPESIDYADRVSPALADFGPDRRAAAAEALIAPSHSASLTAAGTVRAATHTVAVANSHGVDASMAFTGVGGTVLSMGATGGSGWSAFAARGPEGIDVGAFGVEAADIAGRAANPGDLEPGAYQVVLAPDAVAELLEYLAYVGFSAKAVAEGRSFMSERFGESVMSESVTIVDDALASDALGLTFDYEGMPKRHTLLIDAGRVGHPVTDSYWAARLAMANTGHALPAPNSFGPYALDLEMRGGDAGSLDDLIGEVKRGVYVTRFHYTNVEDPKTVLLTGMTRDGTFEIVDGKLGRPLKNQRFTQGALTALSGVQGITAERRHVGTEDGMILVPGVLLESFSFTGQTG